MQDLIWMICLITDVYPCEGGPNYKKIEKILAVVLWIIIALKKT